MICTNPDLIVDKGNRRELCAGSVAMVFEKMGGEVVYFGKPYPEVYNQSTDNKNKKAQGVWLVAQHTKQKLHGKDCKER